MTVTRLHDKCVTEEHLPQDIPAEQATLGAMMLSRRAIDDVCDTLAEADFYRSSTAPSTGPSSRSTTTARPSTSSPSTRRSAPTSATRRPVYLHTMIENTPTVSNVAVYADSIRAHALRRRLVEAGTRIVQRAHGAGDADEAADEAVRAIEAAATTTGTATEHHVADLLDDASDAIDPATPRPVGGVPTGWPEVDLILLPLMPGQMVTVGGARPWASPCRARPRPAVRAPLRRADRPPQPRDVVRRMMQRLLAAEARVSLTHLRMRTLDGDAWARIAKATARISEAPLWIDDTPHAGIPHLRAVVRRRKPAVTVVDYLQLMNTEQGREPAAGRLGAVPAGEAPRQAGADVRRHPRPAQPRLRAPRRPEARPDRPARLRGDRAGLRRRDPPAPREGPPRHPPARHREAAQRRTGEALLSFQGHYEKSKPRALHAMTVCHVRATHTRQECP
jgi:replicative DNA helicase